MPAPIYLDHNASTPTFPEVVEAMRACWAEPHLNPASQHEFGRKARRILEDSRDRVAELLGANTSSTRPDRVVFTSGGTESNNLAIQGLINRKRRFSGPATPDKPHLVTSPIEHPSIATLADHLAKMGHDVEHLAVDSNGVIRTESLQNVLRPETRLVAAMLANNETGVVQPVVELAAICNEHGIPLHTDAAQAAGKLPLNFRELGVATMTIAAHKFGGPVGIGALLVRHDMELEPQLFGGFQQAGVRPGTESVALAVGLSTALELWDANRRDWLARLQQVRNHFEEALLNLNSNACKPVVLGAAAERLPTTSNVAFVGLDRQRLFIALDQAGIACSTGSACASGSSEPSPVLIAMGCEPALISSALRFSFGVNTTLADVQESADRISKVCNGLGR